MTALQRKNRWRESDKGFSLIEMLVVIGIIVVISTIILANNNKFGGQVQLQNLAYDIALSIRQSQVYGISVQRFGLLEEFAPAYGMHLVKNSNTYVLFGDRAPNGIYDISGTEETVQASTIQSGYSISGLFVTETGEAEKEVNSLDITFRRPDPDAYITSDGAELQFGTNGRLSPSNQSIYEEARIQVRSPRGDTQNIIVTLSGQISVQSAAQ